MRYLVTVTGQAPFFTDWFDADNHFVTSEGAEMTVCCFKYNQYTIDGFNWIEIEVDHL